MISSIIIQALLKIKIQPNMSEQEKKQQRICDLLHAKTKTKKISKIIGVSLWPLSTPLDYAVWGILENKTNATSHQNISFPKVSIEEEWNKMSEKFWRHANHFKGVLIQ